MFIVVKRWSSVQSQSIPNPLLTLNWTAKESRFHCTSQASMLQMNSMH